MCKIFQHKTAAGYSRRAYIDTRRESLLGKAMDLLARANLEKRGPAERISLFALLNGLRDIFADARSSISSEKRASRKGAIYLVFGWIDKW